MRLVSKFKDFYDSIRAYGEDKTYLYMRETKDLSKDDYGLFLKCFTGLGRYHDWIPQNEAISLKTVFITFCGKTYVGIQCNYSNLSSYPGLYKSIREYHYDIKSVSAFVLKYGSAWAKDTFIKGSKYSKDRTLQQQFKEMLANNGKQVNTALLIKHHTPVIAEYPDEERERKFCSNPCLKDFNFAKAVDPFRAYQEIDMFISGILTPESKPMPKIPDELKVQSKGFDKYSFRKRKQVKDVKKVS
jgi:hypothetical protein